MEPDLGERPLTLDGGHRNFHGVAALRDRESAKEAQLHDLALPRIEPFQFPEYLIHADYIDFAGFVEFRGEFQAIVPAAFLSAPRDRVIRQGLTHRARKNSQEMSAIFPRRSLLMLEPQKSFVDESGALEGMIR